MYAFGSVVTLTTTVRGSDRELADPAAITVQIMLPDGDLTSPAAGVQDSTGVYHYTFTPTQAGRHIARWVTTSPTGASEETFDVALMWGDVGIFSLNEGKDHLNIPRSRTTDDEELRGFIAATTAVVERHVGAVARRTHTEVFDGGRSAVVLQHPPVLSVTSVTEDGNVLADSAWTIDRPSGVLRRTDGYGPIPFCAGAAGVEVVYAAGRAVIEPNWTLAAQIILSHMWGTQRNTGGGRPQLGGDASSVTIAGSTYSIPNRAVELLGEAISGIG